MTFEQMAEAKGYTPRLLYTIGEVEKISGLNWTVLDTECKAGRLKSVRPEGKARGRWFTPADIDAWIEANTR